MSEYRKAKQTIEVTPGESVKILRELQELSQNELAELSKLVVDPNDRDKVYEDYPCQ